MKRIAAIAVVVLAVAVAPVSRAQYTANFQTNVISGVASNWSGDYLVGSNAFADVLLIEDGGILSNRLGYLGYEASSGSNHVGVAGASSAWSNQFALIVGRSGAGNSLVVSNRGRIFSSAGLLFNYGGIVGYNSSSSNNSVLLTDTGSVWNVDGLAVGFRGSGNSLVISNGGQVVSTSGEIGTQPGSSNNCVHVVGAGSIWSNSVILLVGLSASSNNLVVSDGGQVVSRKFLVGQFYATNTSVRVGGSATLLNEIVIVGNGGSSNSVTVAGGSVFATNLTVGAASTACDHWIQLDSGSVIITNATTNAVLEVRNGRFVLNGGTLQVDNLLMTNSCAQFVRTGGTLIYGTAVLTTNLDADGDGMANGWEQAYGLDPLNAADANADKDGDGQSNLQEYQAGTDSTNSASAFRILAVVATNDDVLVTWATGLGRTNAVQSAADLTGSYTNVSPNIVVTGTVETTTNYLDAGALTNVPGRFYRIRLVP